jgi:hypothetical protein
MQTRPTRQDRHALHEHGHCSLYPESIQHFGGTDMRAQLRNHVASLFLLAPAAVTFTALPSAAQAQPATPQVRGLEVSSDNGIYPGSRLRFLLHGSPRAEAAVHIRGIEGRIPLREVEPGVYVGRYVVGQGDRIEEGSPVRAILSRGDRTVTANYNLPDLGRVAAAPPPQLRIDRFDVVPVDQLVPGTELRFSVEGMPGAVATIELPGVAERVRMREVRPGHYEGSYTIRRSDNVHVSRPIVAHLRAGNEVVTAPLTSPVLASARVTPAPVIAGPIREHERGAFGPAQVPIHIISPVNNARIDGGSHVRGRTAPFASVEIAVNRVPGQNGAPQRVWEQVVRADANGDFAFDFSAPASVPGTRYDVSMTARTADATTEAHLVLYERQG